jgi:hypothetical protein
MAKRALLIGVNGYEHVNPLSGCLNDVELLGGVLTERYGFDASEVTRVIDPDNRRADILAAFDTVVADTQSGDGVLIYYSGHGSQVRDRDGEEPDDMDETIVPRDSGRGAEPNRDITDDEIHSVVQALTAKGADVTFIFDSCHSGSATRGLFRKKPEGAAVRWVTPDARSPEEPAHLQPGTKKAEGEAIDSGWVPSGTHVFVSGCRAEELSNEYPIDGRQQGALTYHLCKQFTDGAELTWESAIEAAGAAVSKDFPEQHPQLEAPDDRRAAAPFGG